MGAREIQARAVSEPEGPYSRRCTRALSAIPFTTKLLNRQSPTQPGPQSQSLFRSYGSSLPTSLTYMSLYCRGCEPWKPDAEMGTVSPEHESTRFIVYAASFLYLSSPARDARGSRYSSHYGGREFAATPSHVSTSRQILKRKTQRDFSRPRDHFFKGQQPPRDTHVRRGALPQKTTLSPGELFTGSSRALSRKGNSSSGVCQRQ